MEASRESFGQRGSPEERRKKFISSLASAIGARVFRPYRIYREVFKRPKVFSEMPNCSGETVVLTGGTRGIGFEVLRKLLLCNSHVILGSRSLSAGEKAVETLRLEGVFTGSVKVLRLDLTLLKSVREFAAEVLGQCSRIDLLINNAGVMGPPYTETKDGYEIQFQVNYLSHFLLTNLLLPKIKETSNFKETACRIVHVASDSNYGGWIDFKELETCKVYAPNKAYSDSKLCQVLHANYLNKLLRSEGTNVRVLSLHPGVIPSDLWGTMGPILCRLLSFIDFIFRTKEDGADTVMYTALSPELEGVGGVYINSCEIEDPNPQAIDGLVQKSLWERSLQLTN